LHKSFILHNSSCLFQSLMMIMMMMMMMMMMMVMIIIIVIREQHCMYNIYALC